MIKRKKKKNKPQFFLGKKKRVGFLLDQKPDTSFKVFSYTEMSEDERLIFDSSSLEDEINEKFRAEYEYVIGPFKTKEAAEYMKNHSSYSCKTIVEAETAAKEQLRNYLYGR